MAAHRCPYCGRFFRPHPRKLSGIRKQKTCGSDACRRMHQRRKYQGWIKRYPGHAGGRRLKIRAWAKIFPDYWRQYRRDHRDYAERDNRRRLTAKKRARRSAKQTMIRRILVDRLLTVKAQRPKRSAKQTMIDRRVDALVDVLVWKERSAKPNLIGARVGLGG